MADLDRALRDARPTSFWLDGDQPQSRPPLDGVTPCDLVVVGGGYAGLWTALLAKERDPGRRVIVLEADRIGHGASGRNGGFCAASLTHGAENGRDRWPAEYATLERMGRENLDELEATLDRYGIDAGFERTGELTVATEHYQVAHLRAHAQREAGVEFLDEVAVRAEVASPTYLAATFDPSTALVDPARLAWGLAEACERLGVRIVEHTPALSLTHTGSAVEVGTARGSVRAGKVALATNAFPTLVRRMRFHTVPVYDYVLMSEPLTEQQQTEVGWSNRQGIGDSANQFHYYRRSADNRILWGGYDAVYYFGGKVDPRHDTRLGTHRLLAEHFYATFPQLEDLRFTHAWGGAIDTCTRFCAFYGTAHRGDVAYALGFTGLGVAATRFAANVVLDLLDGHPTERTQLEMVRKKPLPFPPEPIAWLGITATRWSLDRADRNQGRRNVWLRALDRFGLGFDS